MSAAHSSKIKPYYGIACLCLLLAAPATTMGALTLTLVTTPSVGLVLSGVSGRQFILNTNDTVTGADAGDAISGAAAGQFTIEATLSPASVNILVDNITTIGGLTVNQALCSYNGGAQESCDGTGMNVTSASSATLKVGLDITTTTAHGGGDMASVTLDVSVSYL